MCDTLDGGRRILEVDERDPSEIIQSLHDQIAELRENSPECKHLRVDQWDAKEGLIAYFHERRKCPDCGLKEVSRFGSYSGPLGKVDYIRHHAQASGALYV